MCSSRMQVGQVAVVVSTMLLHAAVAGADEEVAKEIVARLRLTEQSIENLHVRTEYVKLQKFGLPVQEPVRMEVVVEATVARDGRARCDAVGEQVNVGPAPNEVRTYRGRWVGAFDGELAKSLTYNAGGEVVSASVEKHLSWHGKNPLEFTTHYFDKPVTEILTAKGAVVAEEVDWDGRPVVIVDTVPTMNDNDRRKYRFWIDHERGIVVRRALAIQFRAGQPWQEYTRIESREHIEVEPGIWLPQHVKYESVDVAADLTPETLSWSYEGRNHDWQVNQELPRDTFDLVLPQ